jgi:spermidine synthase
MIPRILIDTAKVPGGDGELRLMKRGDAFSIMLGQNELMSSRLSGSEEALSHLACKTIAAVEHPRLLIGGLGMGFTLRAALASLGTDARIVVAELMPAVVKWAEGPLTAIFQGSLSDPRVSVRVADVSDVIRSSSSAFDAILLDVDNGPEALTRDANDTLYELQGLRAARAALRPGGVLAVWSAGPDASFAKRLRTSGFDVDEHKIRAGVRRGARHTIWVATRPMNSKHFT